MSLKQIWTAVIGLLLVTAGLRISGEWSRTRTSAAPPALWSLPVFSLIDQEGRTTDNAALKHQVWIADFFCINGAGISPRTTMVMREILTQLKNPTIGLLSFSVDPQRDTPEKLREYAAGLMVDEKRWRFVTADRKTVLKLASALKVTDGPGSPIVTHSDRLFVIDADGVVRGVYDSNDPRQLKQLIDDAELLASASTPKRVVATTQPARLYTSVATSYGSMVEAMAKDLVCGRDVQASSKTAHCEWEGRSFYFCSDRCRDRFMSDPATSARR